MIAQTAQTTMVALYHIHVACDYPACDIVALYQINQTISSSYIASTENTEPNQTINKAIHKYVIVNN